MRSKPQAAPVDELLAQIQRLNVKVDGLLEQFQQLNAATTWLRQPLPGYQPTMPRGAGE